MHLNSSGNSPKSLQRKFPERHLGIYSLEARRVFKLNGFIVNLTNETVNPFPYFSSAMVMSFRGKRESARLAKHIFGESVLQVSEKLCNFVADKLYVGNGK